MKLSVVIPVYRVESTLDRCLKSIVSQSFADMEVILVDDGSPDRCPQMCDEWRNRDCRIRVIHQPNGGLSAARNTGIQAAQGEFITFADSDDFIGMDTYAPLMAHLAAHPDIDLLEYPVYWHYGAQDQKVTDFGAEEYTDMADYWLKSRAYQHTFAWNKIYRRTLFDTVRYPQGQVFEDIATLPLLLRHARRIATCQKGLYHYCWNENGITALARGQELQMLLNHHLTIIQDRRMFDNRYYMSILNIQMDVCELTGKEPQLPSMCVNPLTSGLSLSARTKAAILNLIGIRKLCRLNTLIHQLLRHPSSVSY